MKRMMMLAAAVTALAAASAGATTYEIDPAHSTMSFKVAHLMVSKVSGRFQKFGGTIDYEKDKPNAWAAQAQIDAGSVDTDMPARDKHLRSADFLDAEKFPTIAFKSVALESKKGKTTLIGDLTLHGVTKRVALALDVSGTVKDPWGGERLGAGGRRRRRG